jgi:hypothetical protein
MASAKAEILSRPTMALLKVEIRCHFRGRKLFEAARLRICLLVQIASHSSRFKLVTFGCPEILKNAGFVERFPPQLLERASPRKPALAWSWHRAANLARRSDTLYREADRFGDQEFSSFAFAGRSGRSHYKLAGCKLTI